MGFHYSFQMLFQISLEEADFDARGMTAGMLLQFPPKDIVYHADHQIQSDVKYGRNIDSLSFFELASITLFTETISDSGNSSQLWGSSTSMATSLASTSSSYVAEKTYSKHLSHISCIVCDNVVDLVTYSRGVFVVYAHAFYTRIGQVKFCFNDT